MPAAHTADRATRSQRGTDTRSRTGAAILAPSLRLSPRRAPGAAPPRARARSSLARRARARAPHWPGGRARHNPLPSTPRAGPAPLRSRRTWRLATTSRQGWAGRGGRGTAPPGGRREPVRAASPHAPGLADGGRKIGFSSRFSPQICEATEAGQFLKTRKNDSRLI